MQLKRLFDVRQSRIPESIGCCAADRDKLPAVVNEAQSRLVFAGGDTGWWGGWQKMVFNVDSADNPYITAPRSVARLIDIDYCRYPVRIQNEFYEFLQAGVGLQSFNTASCNPACQVPEGYDRGQFPTFTDMTANRVLRFYIADPLDEGRRVLVQGTDTNDQTVYSLDGTVQVQGVYVNLTSPFVDTPFAFNTLTGLQKDITLGNVQVWEVDEDTAEQTLISYMEPGEEVAGYRRYFLNGLPRTCCPETANSTIVQVTAMAKLALIPVNVDTDYLLIQNLEALKEECQAVRFGEMDDTTSAQQAQLRHQKAINLLNGELVHYLGKERPAIVFAPFGTAHLRRQLIGSLT